MKSNTSNKSRRRLRKYLGKITRFHGTFKRRNKYGRALMLKMSVDGDIVADHVWIPMPPDLKHTKSGDKWYFDGIVNSYRDSKGRRKYGIKTVKNFSRNDRAKEIVMNDRIGKEHRTRKKWSKRK